MRATALKHTVLRLTFKLTTMQSRARQRQHASVHASSGIHMCLGPPTFVGAEPGRPERHKDGVLHPHAGLEDRARAAVLRRDQPDHVVGRQLQGDRLVGQQPPVVDTQQDVRLLWRQLPAAREACGPGQKGSSMQAHDAHTSV
jgi:hypothetical protein